MADKNSNQHALIEANIDLQLQHAQILLNEKINQVKQLEVSLDKFKTVEIKRIEHDIACAKKEIKIREQELHNLQLKAKAIDVESETK